MSTIVGTAIRVVCLVYLTAMPPQGVPIRGEGQATADFKTIDDEEIAEKQLEIRGVATKGNQSDIKATTADLGVATKGNQSDIKATKTFLSSEHKVLQKFKTQKWLDTCLTECFGMHLDNLETAQGAVRDEFKKNLATDFTKGKLAEDFTKQEEFKQRCADPGSFCEDSVLIQEGLPGCAAAWEKNQFDGYDGYSDRYEAYPAMCRPRMSLENGPACYGNFDESKEVWVPTGKNNAECDVCEKPINGFHLCTKCYIWTMGKDHHLKWLPNNKADACNRCIENRQGHGLSNGLKIFLPDFQGMIYGGVSHQSGRGPPRGVMVQKIKDLLCPK